MNDRGNIVERVRRLLALADSDRNENENEAEAAARIATKLMLENKVEMAEVKRANFDDYLILGCKAGNRQVPRWRRRLLQVLAKYNFCEVMMIRGPMARHRFGGTVFLVGHKDDVHVVRLIHDHVLKQINLMRERAFEHLHAQHLTGSMGLLAAMGIQIDVPDLPRGPQLVQWKDNFNLGVVDGIQLALEHVRYQAAVDEHTQAIVHHSETQTRDFMKQALGDVKEQKDAPKEVKDINAYMAGRVAASELDITTGEERTSRGYHLEAPDGS
jgi:hypothetical protein